MTVRTAKLKRDEVVNVYTKTAPIYDFWGRLTETKAREISLELANIQNGETILEVAIGTGLTFQQILFANPDGENYGIDLTQAMLEKARARMTGSLTENYTIAIGDAYQLDFSDDYFDLLVNNYMFDLLPEEDFPVILNEFKRVLKPNGRLILVNMTKGERFYQHFWEFVYQVNPKWLGGCRGVLLSQHLSDTGFNVLRRETLSQFGFPSEIISASL